MKIIKNRKITIIYLVTFSIIFLVPMFFESVNSVHADFILIENTNQNGIVDYQVNNFPNETTLEDFLDDVVSFQRTYYGVPGVTVSAVKDNQLLFTKGYGYRNISTFDPVVANETIFRVGSISKTFTAVAAMQLVEDGVLDLDANVNEYLTTFQIPNTFKNPITLRHLLTHTAGFEEYSYRYYYLDEEIPLEEIARVGLPDRVHPPGLLTGYSNYGYTLIGYLVELVSGIDFEEYIKTEITEPLGMNSTTFEQPLPIELEDNISASYNLDGSEWELLNFTISPAASCSSTALDMSKFMITLLNNGTYNGTQILQNETAQMMKTNQFSPHPNLPGVGFGLYDIDMNNVEIIGHGGDVPDYHSNMLLFPTENFGLFISYNSLGGQIAKEDFVVTFLENFFPYSSTITPMKRYDKNLSQYAGRYLSTRRFYSEKEIYNPFLNITFSRLPHEFLDYFSNYIVINEGYIQIEGLDLDFVQVEHDYFVEATGEYDLEIIFIRNNRGQVSHYYANFMTSLTAMEKMSVIHEGSNLYLYVMIPIGSLFVLGLIWWIIEAIIKAIRKEKASFFRLLPKILPFGFLASTALIIGLMQWKSNQIIFIDGNMIPYVDSLLILPILSVVFLAGMFVSNFLAWTGVGNNNKSYWNLMNRIFYAVLTFLGFSFIWLITYWNLLG